MYTFEVGCRIACVSPTGPLPYSGRGDLRGPDTRSGSFYRRGVGSAWDVGERIVSSGGGG